MIRTYVGALWRSHLRDRPAVALSFILPLLFFFVFAAIFAGATGDSLRLDVAVADEVRSETSQRLLDGLALDPAVELLGREFSASEVRDLVRRSVADIGLIVRADAEPLESAGGFGPAPILLVGDRTRAVAVPMLAGVVQRAYFSAVPDVALGSVVNLLEDQFIAFTPEQRTDLEEGLAELRAEAQADLDRGEAPASPFEDLMEREDLSGKSAASNHVAYYASAVAMLFVLLSAVQGSVVLLEEPGSGLVERFYAGPARSRVLVDGTFLFLLAQACGQFLLIYLAAWALFGVPFLQHGLAWGLLVTTASVGSVGIAMGLVGACRTRRQAMALGNTVALLLSAIGGSMVPRFLMPEWLQGLGWLTPNAWALEATMAIFWREEPLSSILEAVAVLTLLGLAGWWAARTFARRREVW